MADIKWSAFPSIGALASGDILVGLRAGANVRFSSLTIPWSVANGGTGAATLTAYTLLTGGTTPTGALQQVGAGSAGQLLQSNGGAALPSWTTATFPSGAATLNKLLRGDGTNWVATTATTLTSADVLSGLTQLNVDNLRLDGNAITATNAGGNLTFIPDATGNVDIFTPPASESSSITVNGFAFNTAFRVNDIGTVAPAQAIIHRHSTTLEPVLLFARANSDTDAHAAVTNGMALSSTYSTGWTGAQYSLFGQVRISADATGTINDTSAPGKLDLMVSPNGSITPATALSINNAGVVTLVNALLPGSGGTGLSSLTAYALLAGGTTSTGVLQQVGVGSSGQVLQSNGASALPSYSTATFPATAGTTGTILRSNGTNWINSAATFADTYAASSLLYSNGANTVAALATANNGVLITSAGGVPSISSTLPTLVQQNSTVMGTNSAVSINASAPASSLVMDSTGRVTTPANPVFVVTGGAASNVTGNAVGYTILFATAGTNVGSNYATGTGLFTAPINGTYSFTASVSLTGLVFPTNTLIFSGFIIDGSVTKIGYYNNVQATVSDPTIINFSAIVRLNASQTVGIWVRVSGGTKIIGIGSDSFYSGVLIG